MTNENNEDNSINEKKIIEAYNSKLKIHISFKNRTYRNGSVINIPNSSTFDFADDVNGKENFFFLELYKVESFEKEEKKE